MNTNKRHLPTKLYVYLGLFCLIFCLVGCNSTKELSKNQYLLKSNHVILQDKSEVPKEDLEDIIKQKPNRKFLGFLPIYLYLNNLGKRGRDSSKIRLWLRNISEEPVVLDSLLLEKSRSQMQLFLRKKGYYDASVADSVWFHPKKNKVKVYYLVDEKQPYTINKIRFSIDDNELMEPIKIATQNTLIRPGANADEYMLGEERDRMTKAMRNQGYYTFSAEYVFFQIDTSIQGNKVDVKLQIKNPTKVYPDGKGGETIIKSLHKKYNINKVFISTQSNSGADLLFEKDTIIDSEYYIIYSQKLDYRPEVLLKNTFVKPFEMYRLQNTEYNYKRMAGLRTFKFIKIRYEENFDTENTLDCFINLTAAPKRSFSLETEGTHRGGNLGVAASLTTRNKNTFKGAEIFEFKLKGGLEAQTLSEEDKQNLAAQTETDLGVASFLFNTIEYGAEVSLFIPELLRPRNKDIIPFYTEPKTNINLAYNFQKRPFYDRSIFNIALKYSWKVGDYHNFAFHPIDLSYIDITKDPVFEKRLAEINNTLLTSSYSDNLIPATRVSYIFSNQDVEIDKNFSFFRINLEAAGNSLNALKNPLNLKYNEDGYYEAFNVRFAQYVKTDADFRLYNLIDQNSKLVYRIFGGIGIPISNIASMPFEKSFFAGGSNDQRAWTARTLGPGSVSDSVSFKAIDQIGDVALGGNIEYRFKVVKMIEGAAFIDAGNIWLQKEDTKRPGGDFKLDRFYKEIAMGAGLGARLNFGFFIIRLDASLPIRDPALPEGERWIFEAKDKYNDYYGEFLKENDIAQYNSFIERGGYRRYRVRFNLGIGYPF